MRTGSHVAEDRSDVAIADLGERAHGRRERSVVKDSGADRASDLSVAERMHAMLRMGEVRRRELAEERRRLGESLSRGATVGPAMALEADGLEEELAASDALGRCVRHDRRLQHVGRARGTGKVGHRPELRPPRPRENQGRFRRPSRPSDAFEPPSRLLVARRGLPLHRCVRIWGSAPTTPIGCGPQVPSSVCVTVSARWRRPLGPCPQNRERTAMPMTCRASSPSQHP
jgi:hypothetical protein